MTGLESTGTRRRNGQNIYMDDKNPKTNFRWCPHPYRFSPERQMPIKLREHGNQYWHDGILDARKSVLPNLLHAEGRIVEANQRRRRSNVLSGLSIGQNRKEKPIYDGAFACERGRKDGKGSFSLSVAPASSTSKRRQIGRASCRERVF